MDVLFLLLWWKESPIRTPTLSCYAYFVICDSVRRLCTIGNNNKCTQFVKVEVILGYTIHKNKGKTSSPSTRSSTMVIGLVSVYCGFTPRFLLQARQTESSNTRRVWRMDRHHPCLS